MIAVYGYWVDNRSERIIKRDKNSTDIRLTNELDLNNGSISFASWRRSSFSLFNYKSHDAVIAEENTQVKA